MVSYSISTYKKAKQFQQKLNELQETIAPSVIRAYFTVESASQEERKKWDLALTDDERAQLDELKALRIAGIQSEMKYALAQAKKNGVQLSEQVVSGEAIVPGFSPEILEKVPSLGVYQLFLLFTKEEFDLYEEKL